VSSCAVSVHGFFELLQRFHQKFNFLSPVNNMVPPILGTIYRSCAVIIMRPALSSIRNLSAHERVPRSLLVSTSCK
jgi:hypothetical protein